MSSGYREGVVFGDEVDWFLLDVVLGFFYLLSFLEVDLREGRQPCETLEEHDACGPDVDFVRVGLFVEDFRRHVVEGADEHAVVDENVAGLDVSVDDASPLEVFEGQDDVSEDGCCFALDLDAAGVVEHPAERALGEAGLRL